MTEKYIEILGARQHNLKNLNVKIPRRSLTVITGPSGSGKSSLAFNTLFAEGQRRYVESLSTYARQFLDKHEKPDVDDILNISPTIAIEQKNHTKNSRSTVGTATEIYDYLRLLFAKVGVMHSHITGKPIKKDVVFEVIKEQVKKNHGSKAYMLYPFEFSSLVTVKERRFAFMSFLESGHTKVVMESGAKPGKKLKTHDIQEALSAEESKLFGEEEKAHKVYVVVDRFEIDKKDTLRFSESLVQAYKLGLGRAHLAVLDDSLKITEFSNFYDYPSAGDGKSKFPDLTPLLFSFNSPMGACPKCNGFGKIQDLDKSKIVPNDNISISQGAIDPLSKPSAKEWLRELMSFCQDNKISLHIPWNELSDKDKNLIWDGDGKEYPGVLSKFRELEENRYKVQVRVFLSRYRSANTCTECKGARLRVEARHVFIHKKGVHDLTALSIQELYEWINKTKFTKKELTIAADILPQVKARLEFLLRVGLDYLSLSRMAKTLSGGETQRIALANQLGSRLTQTCYVLDEPSIGLHPKDTEQLIGILKELSDLNNTVVVVEHDADIIEKADYLIDIGPNAGTGGGELLYQGDFEQFRKEEIPVSSTWNFLTKKEEIPVPRKRRVERFEAKAKRIQWLEAKGLTENNLDNVNLKIPLNMLTCVSGVSGSGKSSAIRKTLYPALAKMFLKSSEDPGEFEKISGYEAVKNCVLINQDPIGRSPRSNPITFMKGWDEVRSLFASAPDAKKRNYHQGFFSFNVPGGRCEHCQGEGYQRIEMQFMEDMFILCEHCEGKRFKKDVLDIEYKGKNIFQVLELTVSEARRFFKSAPRLQKVLGVLEKVGLGYLRLGQPATTLSGGESQRLKIARELASIHKNNVIYFLDEPTTGLHFRDVKVLIKVLHDLVEQDNTVVVIEHNLEVMKGADWIIDFGPGGGSHGGKVTFSGVPEKLVTNKKSYTAKYLKPVLEQAPKISFREYMSDES